ncbi:MAG: alpha/beta family hydrolase [Steroidobacteraceae bacterium]
MGELRPPAPQPAVIAGPQGALEARVEDPSPGTAPRAVGVVCHPHPLHGGTMQNKVVHTLGRAMQELGVPTVRFNFRGVGASDGAYGDGVGEVDDALAAVAWARERWRCDALWLAGFSFGSAVSLEAARVARPAALVSVAPPVGRIIVGHVERPACPWLVVQGDRDELVDAQAVRAWAASFDPPPELSMLDGAEHFFHGRLGELRDRVSRFLSGI